MNELEYRKQHEERKQKVMDLLQQAQELYAKMEENDKSAAFESLKKDVENGEFSIVLIGEFSAGKSSLLNALMHENLLPSFTSETTATVNFLRHISRAPENARGVVYYDDDTEEKIPSLDKKTIEQYATTRGDDVAHRIRQIDLYLDSDYLKDGVTLVDSPGLNGIQKDLSAITEQQIMKSHASIFVFSGNQPGSKSEFQILGELRNKVDTIFIVLNKIDLIKESEGDTPESIVATLKKDYRKLYPDAEVPEIWPVAAMPALVARSEYPMEYNKRKNFTAEEKQKLEQESRLSAFEDRLMRFLTQGEKTKQELMEPVSRVLKDTYATEQALTEERDLLSGQKDTSELQDKIDAIKEQMATIQSRMDESCDKVRLSVKNAASGVEEGIIGQLEKYAQQQQQNVRDIEDIEELQTIAKTFDASFNRKVMSLMSEGEEDFRSRLIEEVCSLYKQERAAIQSCIEQNAVDMSDVKLDIQVELPALQEAGIEKMHEQEEAVRKELEEIQSKIAKIQADSSEARQMARKQWDLQQKREKYEQYRETIENRLILEPQMHMEDDYKSYPRDGLFGKMGNFLFGEKREKVQMMKLNPGEKERYDREVEQKQKRTEEYTKRIDELTKELQDMTFDDPDELANREKREMARESGKMDELQRLIQENKERIQEKYENNLRIISRTLCEYVEDGTVQLKKILRKELRELTKQYAEVISMVVGAGIQKELEAEQEKKTRMEEQIKSSEQDKQLRMDKLNEQIAALEAIRTDAVALRAELNAIEVDTIQTDVL